MTINNVSLGDRFKVGKNGKAKVVDLREVRSIVTGLVTGYQCIAAGEGLATNHFEVPFSTVVRNRFETVADIQEVVEQLEAKKDIYIALDERCKELGRFDSVDEALTSFPSWSFVGDANSYDIYNAEGKREKGTKWLVFNSHYYSKATFIGCIKRPNI